ncbi:MAG: hypothetical protein WKF34_01900 [Pyrinomonadaceae bacterium]
MNSTQPSTATKSVNTLATTPPIGTRTLQSALQMATITPAQPTLHPGVPAFPNPLGRIRAILDDERL